jgi:GTP-binding protein
MTQSLIIKEAQFVHSVVGSHNVVNDEKPQIAFVGRSNVGKSSLINMLVGQKNLVRSSSTPGKTQMINYFLVNKVVYFVDLPGYGYAKLSMKYREKLRKLILWYFVSGEAEITKVVLIIDAKIGVQEFDREMIAVLDEHDHPFIVVANKCDKLNQTELHHALVNIQAELPEDVIIVPASASKNRGRQEILEEILET